MKAAVIHEFGDENVFVYEDVEEPEISPNSVLINVKAASINRGDLSRRQGNGLVEDNLPFVLGWDVAGDITEIGENVSHLRVGQRVLARIPSGGYAEIVSAPESIVVPIPNDVEYDQAASLPVAYLTAWVLLLDTAALSSINHLSTNSSKKSEEIEDAPLTVLIHSGGSGVGTAGIQIAKEILGARVFATAGTDKKVNQVKEIGADDAINYNKQDFVVEIRRLTQGVGVNAAIESIGGDIFMRTQQTLAENGCVVSYGRTSGTPPTTDLDLAKQQKQRIVTGWTLGNARTPEMAAQDLTRIINLVAEGRLKTYIDRVFPLSEVSEAHRFVANRSNFGKVILRP
ncbi:MAG: zinc-binding dehydrogenase [SAR202 cluster bacterium]|nr:zinc-binding dehydrogenase [SAR202 cluster bacterium]|tara:strand:- start:75 stop:1103 length:1029 start_codon:yes stop_codon:yes gene_type:complete